MNIQEAVKNIGKQVYFNAETKPYTNSAFGATLDRINVAHSWIRSVFKDEGDCCVVITDDKYNKQEIYIKPEHLELKQDMKPIKIRLYNSKQFKPVFKKLIKLGYHADSKPPAYAQYIYTLKDGRICYDFFKSTDDPFIAWSDDKNPDDLLNYFNEHKAEEVLVTDLLDKKKNHSLYLTDELRELVEKHAQKTNRSFNGMVTEMILAFERGETK